MSLTLVSVFGTHQNFGGHSRFSFAKALLKSEVSGTNALELRGLHNTTLLKR